VIASLLDPQSTQLVGVADVRLAVPLVGEPKEVEK
jgi:hypothetical protein